MVASAFPLADVLLRNDQDAEGADGAVPGRNPSSDDLPFPPQDPAAGGANAGNQGSDDASSVLGPFANRFGASSGTGSAVLDQVLGASRMMGYDVGVPALPIGKLANTNPLRPAILEWIAVTNAEVDAKELADQLARADALPQPLQRDLALVILSAAEATLLQREATKLLTPEMMQWLRENPEVASDLARGVDTPHTRHLAFLAGLVDTHKSMQAAMLVLSAAEATRGSLASAQIEDALVALPDAVELDPYARQLFELVASAGSQASDADKLRFAARLVALTSGVPMPEPATTDATFAEAVDALLRATGAAVDPADLADVLGRARMLPDDLERALALPLLAQARAVDASNPLYWTPAGQSEALVHVLLAVADALPTLEKYHLYWKTAPDALRVSTWDSAARLGWAIEHAALVASTRGDLADLARAGGLLQGLGLVDADVPQRSFADAILAIAAERGVEGAEADRDGLVRASEILEPAVRDAAAVMLSGTAEAARLHRLAFAELSASEKKFLLEDTLDIDAILENPNPTHEEIQHLARGTALAQRVDRASLIASGVAGARATFEAAEILRGADAYSAASASVRPVETGFGAFLSRLMPIGTAQAQNSQGCVDIADTLGNFDILSVFGVTNDCENDVLLRVSFERLPFGITPTGPTDSGNGCTTTYESPNRDILVVTGIASAAHTPPMDTRSEDCATGGETNTPRPMWGAPHVSIDLGGSDTYLRPVAMTYPGQPIPVSLHLDVGGAEFYADPTNQFDARSPIFRLVDRRYGHPTQGAAMGGGVAILLDVSGDDRYEAMARSQGYGHLGVGMLGDLSGNDGYSAWNYTQGSASENWNAGLGILFDATGNDAYSARGGQGYGVGGIFLDAGGRDSYMQPEPARGVPVVHVDSLPAEDVTALNERADGRVWIDGPANLHSGVGIDIESTTSGRDSDGDGDSDFLEFLAGSDPRNARERAVDGPNARLQIVAGDSDRDLYPDFIERALGTDSDDARSYPAGIPIGPTFYVPLVGTISPGSLVLGLEGTPRQSGKIIDLRLPLHDSVGVDQACTGWMNITVNNSVVGGRGTTVPVTGNRCALVSYNPFGDGTGNATRPPSGSGMNVIGEPERADRFSFRFPTGILAVGDSIFTEYDEDYFFVVDLGGDDRFRNRAGGSLPVRTAPEAGGAQATDQNYRAFLAPSLVVNVDLVEGVGEAQVRNADDSLGRDSYEPPANDTSGFAPGDYMHGSLYSVLVDTGGDDEYIAGNGSQGALGGVLADLRGADNMSALAHSQGVSLTGADRTHTGPQCEDSGNAPALACNSDGTYVRGAPAGLLLNFGEQNDVYQAGSRSQGFAHNYDCESSCGQPVIGVLLDAGGRDVYDTATQRGIESQGVAGGHAIGLLMDIPAEDNPLDLGVSENPATILAGLDAARDIYRAYGMISQGSTVSSSHHTPIPEGAALQQPERFGIGALIDLSGVDSYTWKDARDATHNRHTRQDNLHVERQEALYSGTTGNTRYRGPVGLHLDAEAKNPVGAIGAIGGTGGDSPANPAGRRLVDLPTARLAIGSDADTQYDHEYALVIDLGGDNSYRFNAGGFVPDVLMRGQADPGQNGGHGRATSLFPVSLVLDVGNGSSNYTASDLLSQGAGFFSVGVLIDAGGHDALVAMPHAQWAEGNEWKSSAVIPDGILTNNEWSEITRHTVKMVGTRDPRYSQDAGLRIANDGHNLYMALELSTESRERAELFGDRIEIQMNPGRTLEETQRAPNGSFGHTGIDEMVLGLGEDGCYAYDRHWNGNTFMNDTKPANALPSWEPHNVRFGCRYDDGRWTLEVVKPFAPRFPQDTGDMVFRYDPERGFVEDRDVAFRVSFRDQGLKEIYAFPGGSTKVDGDYGYQADGSLTDEMAAWAAFRLANLGETAVAPRNTRVAALSQGAGLAGVGVLAMLGNTNSSGTYLTSDRSQAFAGFGGAGMLFDAGGADVYRASDQAQGAATTEGLAVFIDADGSDQYYSNTLSNGYGKTEGGATQSVGHAVFLDLHGYDLYETPGFSAASLPDCATREGAGCDLQQEVDHAKGNQKSWRNGAGGVGVDYLSNDDVRATAASAYEAALFGFDRTRLHLKVANATTGCSTGLALPSVPVDMRSGKPVFVLNGTVCFVVDTTLSNTGYGETLGAAVQVDSIQMVIDGAAGQEIRKFQSLSDGRTVWAASFDTRELEDGVKTIAASALYRVEFAGRGVILYATPVVEREGIQVARAIVNNEPSLTLDLEPKVDGAVMFSPFASNVTGMPNRLFVNWSVTHDSGEDRLEAVQNYAPESWGRNVPCADPASDEQLCHLLPFYFDSQGTWDTARGDARNLAIESSGYGSTQGATAKTTAPLRTPLYVSLEDPFIVHLPDRTAVLDGHFNTTFRIGLYDESGQVRINDKNVYIANGTFHSEQKTNLGDLGSNLADPFLIVRQNVSKALTTLTDLSEDNALRAAMELALRTTCRQSFEGENTDTPYFCDAIYGDPSFGNVAPCRSGNPHYTPTVCDQIFGDVGFGGPNYVCMLNGQALYKQQCATIRTQCETGAAAGALAPLCDPLFSEGAVSFRFCAEDGDWYVAILNESGYCRNPHTAGAMLKLSDQLGPALQELLVDGLTAQLNEVQSLMDPADEYGLNWTVFHLDIAHDEALAAGLTIENGKLVIPPGYRLHFEMFVVRDGLVELLPEQVNDAYDSVAQNGLNDYYRNVLLPYLNDSLKSMYGSAVAAREAREEMLGELCADACEQTCETAGTSGACEGGEQTADEPWNVTVVVDDPSPDVPGGAIVVGLNVTDRAKSQLELINLAGADERVANPIPVSVFRYGGPDDTARLDIRVPAEPSTLASVTIESVSGDLVVELLNRTVEGDVGDTPTNAFIDSRGFIQYDYNATQRGHRFTERVTLADARDENGNLLPDGRYIVRVRVIEPYTNVYREKSMEVLLDRTDPKTFVTTPPFVGEVDLALANNFIPISWTVNEEGSGHAATHVFTNTNPGKLTSTSNCMSTSDNGEWWYQGRVPNGTFSVANQIAATRLLIVTISEDFAGNLEDSDGLGLCEALAKKIARGSGPQGFIDVRTDTDEPGLASAQIDGARRLVFQGSDFAYVRAGTPVAFRVCAFDAEGGGGIEKVLLQLDNVNVTSGSVLSRSYQATRIGDCARGDLWEVNQWGNENLDKAVHPDGIWSSSFVVYDMGRNAYEIPVSNLILDSVAPTLTLADPVYPPGQSAIKGGDSVSLLVHAEDDFGVDDRAITLDISALNETGQAKRKTTRIDGVPFIEYSFRVDRLDIENGAYSIPITVPDNAGNERTAAFDVVVDFRRFEVVPGSLEIVNVTHNSAIVRWETTENTTSQVRFGDTLELRQRTEIDMNLTKEHAVLVTGLTPSTRYHFRAVSSSAGGFTETSDAVIAETLTALFLEKISPVGEAAVNGNVPLVFAGGLRDADEFVTYTLYVQQPHKGDEWTFVTTMTRRGDEHTIEWNSSRYLDGEGYLLRVTAKAGEDEKQIEFGPLLSDNAAPVVTILSPAAATNDTTPLVHIEARDALSGFGTDAAVLLIDGVEIEANVTTERTDEGLRVRHTVPSALTPGVHKFEVRVTDRAGNLARHAWDVHVDSIAPQMRENRLSYMPGTSAAKAGGHVLLNLTITDESGVDEVVADASSLKPGQTALRLTRVEGTNWWTALADVTARDDAATKLVRVTAVDLAQNARFLTLEIPVDNLAPVVRGVIVSQETHTSAQVSVTGASEPITIVVKATDAGSPDASAATTTPSTTPSLKLEGLLPSREYRYELRAIDGAGNEAVMSSMLSTREDDVAPGEVGQLKVVDLLNGTLRLSWAPATDDVAVAVYRIYRSADGIQFQAIADVKGTTYDDGQLPYEKSFTYKVVAVDYGKNEGTSSPALVAQATAVPRLAGGAVSPTLGTTSTVFRYTVTYMNAGGKAPDAVRVIIDGVPHNMTRQEGGDFVSGVTYAYEMRLAPHTRDAPHTYSFEATDGRYSAKFPADGTAQRGPLVSPESLASDGGGFASFAQRVPLGGMAGITLAVIAAALVAAIIVRKKKGGSN